MRYKNFVAPVLFGFLACASAQPPKQDIDLAEIKVTMMGVELGEHTLADVRTTIGGNVYQSGEAGDSHHGICFRKVDNRHDVVVFFYSNSMASSPGVITKMGLARSRLFPSMEQCAPLKNDIPELSVGAQLGMKTTQLRQLFGEPTSFVGSKVVFQRITHKLTTPDEKQKVKILDPSARHLKWDVLIDVRCEIEDQLVQSIEISKIISY